LKDLLQVRGKLAFLDFPFTLHRVEYDPLRVRGQGNTIGEDREHDEDVKERVRDHVDAEASEVVQRRE